MSDPRPDPILDDGDPQGMEGQLDDSMNDLEPHHDLDEASRGIPQNAEETDGDEAAELRAGADPDGPAS